MSETSAGPSQLNCLIPQPQVQTPKPRILRLFPHTFLEGVYPVIIVANSSKPSPINTPVIPGISIGGIDLVYP